MSLACNQASFRREHKHGRIHERTDRIGGDQRLISPVRNIRGRLLTGASNKGDDPDGAGFRCTG